MGFTYQRPVDYRTTPCATCDAPSTGVCPRCSAPVCGEHGGSPWCVACETERRDDLELATAEAALTGHLVIEDHAGRVHGLTFFTLLANVVARPFRVRRARAAAERTFRARAPAEILAARDLRAQRR